MVVFLWLIRMPFISTNIYIYSAVNLPIRLFGRVFPFLIPVFHSLSLSPFLRSISHICPYPGQYRFWSIYSVQHFL